MENFNKIPLNDNQKTPSMSGWSGCSQEMLQAFTTFAKSSKNHGVLCGEPNGIIVFDYDTYKTDLNISLESLKSIHGQDCHIIKTPSGGFHVYHKLSDETKEWKGLCGINGYLDIRTTGNYVVGAGSFVDGKEYKLLQKASKLSPVPDTLFESINEQMNKPTSSTSSNAIDKQEIHEHLENAGFTNIIWKNGYDFDCNQRGKGSTCPLCDSEHRNNHFFVYENEVGIFVKNHSNRCRTKKIKSNFLFTEEEKQQLIETDLPETYMAQKRKFEKFGCFIEEEVFYAITNQDGSIDVLNPKKLRDRYADWSYEGKDGKKHKFIDTWICDNNKRRFLKIDFIPENCPESTFNLWKGYEIEKHLTSSNDIQPFMDLVKQLTDNDTEYFIKWLAQLFKHPGSKPITSPVFTSVQGTGKNSLFDFIGRLMGNNLYYETADAENNLFGRFSNAIEKCKLLFIDEMEGSAGFRHSARLKALISNIRHIVERKGLDAYEVQNLAGIVFATNNPNPVKVESSDRRFFVYNPQKNLDQEFFNMWRKWATNKDNQRAVYEYLMSVNVEDVDWIADRPKNTVYEEMRYNALPSFIKWLDYTIVENFKNFWINKPVEFNTLFEDYKSFGHTIEKSSIQFAKELKRLIEKEGLVGFEKTTKSSKGMRYYIDREKVFGWLKEKHYTLADNLEPVLEIQLEENGNY
jgi:hypothetical protein